MESSVVSRQMTGIHALTCVSSGEFMSCGSFAFAGKHFLMTTALLQAQTHKCSKECYLLQQKHNLQIRILAVIVSGGLCVVCVCGVCVCVCVRARMCACVCVCVCVLFCFLMTVLFCMFFQWSLKPTLAWPCWPSSSCTTTWSPSPCRSHWRWSSSFRPFS